MTALRKRRRSLKKNEDMHATPESLVNNTREFHLVITSSQLPANGRVSLREPFTFRGRPLSPSKPNLLFRLMTSTSPPFVQHPPPVNSRALFHFVFA